MINFSPARMISIPRPVVMMMSTVSILVAFILFIAAVLIMVTPDQGRVMTTHMAASAASAQCSAAAKKLGFDFIPDKNPNLAYITLDKFTSMETLMARTDSLLGRCQGYELHDLCAGDGCGTKQVIMTLNIDLSAQK